MLKITNQQQPQTITIDEETRRFREDCEINNHINKILKEDLREWETSSLLMGLDMMQDLFLQRIGLPDLYNKGIKTSIKRILDVLKPRNAEFTLRIPADLLLTF